MNSTKKRPNIIILNPDEMRWDTMGHMGNPAAHTPALDHFAMYEAVSFDHAYCQNPVCVPSRCSFFTGLYPHTRGHRTMRHLLHEGETTLFKQLKEAGYYVWLNGRNDLIAGQFSGLEEQHADEIYYYDKTKPAPPMDLQKLAELMGVGQRRTSNGKEQTAPDGSAQTAPNKSMQATHSSNHPADSSFSYDHFGGVKSDNDPIGAADWADTYAAVDRILHPVEPDKPLCLFLGWTNPHPPYQVEQTYYDKIDPERVVTEIQSADCKGKSKMMEKLWELSGLENHDKEQWLELRRVYLAQCAKVDAMFDVVCNALKEAGIYDDSAIFFLSDHGDFAGDYHLAEKAQNSFEDVLTRVPLLIKPPKMTDEAGNPLYPCDPGLSSGMVELIDFYATAMEYAGVEPAENHFGRSLQAAIENREVHVREFACCEGGRMPDEPQCDEWHGEPPLPGIDAYWAKKTAQLDDAAHEKGTMITNGHYKFIQRLNDDHELYDLHADPFEQINLYAITAKNDDGTLADAALQQTVLKMQTQLLRWYQETCDVVPKTYDNRYSEERIWGTLRNFVPATMEEIVRNYIRREQPTLPEAIKHGIKMLMEQVETNAQ